MKVRSKRTSRRRLLEPGINLTPLLDAIFNLVFFFLLATQLRQETFQTEVRLPSSEMAAEAAGDLETLMLAADGRVFFADRTITDEELELTLATLVRQGISAIAIRGDTDVGLGRLHEVIDVCRRAGIETVSLMSERPLPAATH